MLTCYNVVLRGPWTVNYNSIKLNNAGMLHLAQDFDLNRRKYSGIYMRYVTDILFNYRVVCYSVCSNLGS